MTGSLQIKSGKYYAVINYKDELGKRRQKWINSEIEAKNNKRKADAFLQKVLLEYGDATETEREILFCDYIRKWLLESKKQSGAFNVAGVQKYCRESHISIFLQEKD